MRQFASMFALLALLPAPSIAAQSVDTTVTPAGDTVINTVYASAKPVVVEPVVTVDSVLTRVIEAPRGAVYASTPYPLGRPFGVFNGYSGYSVLRDGPWTLVKQSSGPAGILQQLEAARAGNRKVVLDMTGGSHSKYITDGKFDLGKWQATQKSYDTPAIRAAVDAAIADGILLATSMVDEPNHSSWGGAITPAMIDEMSRYVKAIFPSLKTAVVVQWSWQKDIPYTSLDYIISQYAYRLGSLAAYVDSAQTTTNRRGIGLMFSMNILDGGTRLDPCPAGKYNPATANCYMTATEIVEAGKALLGSKACGLLMWQYDDAYMGRPENLDAFAELATYASRQPAPPCKRPE